MIIFMTWKWKLDVRFDLVLKRNNTKVMYYRTEIVYITNNIFLSSTKINKYLYRDNELVYQIFSSKIIIKEPIQNSICFVTKRKGICSVVVGWFYSNFILKKKNKSQKFDNCLQLLNVILACNYVHPQSNVYQVSTVRRISQGITLSRVSPFPLFFGI